MAKVQLEAILKLVDVQVNPQVFRKISQSVAGMPPALAKTNAHLKNASTNSKKLNSNLDKTKTKLSNNERAARMFLQRMAQFAILLPTFATLNRAIQGSVKFLFEFDSALRDIVRIDISGLSDRMEEVGDAALQTAVDFGVTATEVLNVTRVFKQAGFTIEESQAKASAAILATQISTLSSAQATEVFIAAQKQFRAEGENSISVLDKLAKVEDVAAVNASDVADAFRAGGNALAEFSGSIDDSIGLIAALREQSRKSGREIGTFLKTIQTRLFAAGDARSAVEGLGVSVENLDGSLRPTLDVLNDLKERFDGLTQAQAANAAKSIAGIRQFESLLATLNSLERANELSAESSKAAGTADAKRLITDAKLERQLGRLVAQGQSFAEALGDAGLEDALGGVLKMATRLLSIFTNLTDAIGSLGGDLTPLLALTGVTLGRGVFGLAGGGGGGGAAKSGGAGPTSKASATAGAESSIKRFGAVVSSTGKMVANFGMQVTTSTAISKQHGIQANIDSQALKSHVTAIKANAVALNTSKVSALNQAKGMASSTAGLVGLTVAATFLPALFQRAEDSVRGLNGATAETSANLIGIGGNGITLAAQFAFLGGKAAGIAGAFGLITESSKRLFDAFEENQKAIKDSGKTNERTGRVDEGELRFLQTNDSGKKALSTFFDNLSNGVRNAKIGNELGKGIQDALSGTASSDAFKDLKISGDELSEALFRSTDVVRALVGAHDEEITATAERLGRTEQLIDLQKGLADESLSAGQAIGLLSKVLGAGSVAINEFTGKLQRDLNFKDFKAAQGIESLADKVRTLGLELEVAKLGPDALSDSVVRLQTELLIAERESDNTIGALTDRLGKLFSTMDEAANGLDSDAGVVEFFNQIMDGTKTLDASGIKEFNNLIEQSAPKAKANAKEILKTLEARASAELDIQKKRNDVESGQSARSQALLDAETQATQNAFAATEKFTAELAKFGQSVSSDVLSVFQNVSLGDVEDVLGNTSELDSAVQELIRNAFGDPIVKAQNELQAVSAKTQAELNVLSSELENVESKLSDQANAANFAALTTQKHAIELSIEKTKQDGAVASTEAKIKVLENEKEAAEDAAEAEKKRQDLLEKLADAARDFDTELKSVERSFADFNKQKIADLLTKEADARGELKEAQQEVLDTTSSLAEAYGSLIKAQLEFNGVIAEAQLKSNLLARDIGMLTGEIFSLDGELSSIGDAFRNVLDGANVTLEKRIDLERQLAEETLSFLQQARDEIVQSGLGVFGQTGAENQSLGQGIQGLQFIADQLGGSFESFLSLTQGELSDVTGTLLSLPAEFRQQILDALSALPSTASIGGFSVDQLTQAIGQVGAGVSTDAGLPSIEELNGKQVEQLTKLQDLALQDAQLQFAQVIAAQDQVAAAEEAAEAAKLLEERSSENLSAVRDAVLEEKAVLDLANSERRDLLTAVVAADDKNTLMQIEKEAQLFAEQNSAFREVGDNIVRGISSAIGAKLAIIEAGQNVNNAARGFIPNFSSGNLSPGEAASLLRAGAREKRAMPGGAGLAVANTSEAIIPMRSGGFIPNFQEGSDISSGISAIRGINETVVAAITRSVTSALSDLQSGSGSTEDLLTEVVTQLSKLNSTSDDINASSISVASSTKTSADASGGGTSATSSGSSERIEVTLQTNQNNTIAITGLESLRNELAAAMQDAAAEQVDSQVESLLLQLDEIFTALQQRGLLSSFGQAR